MSISVDDVADRLEQRLSALIASPYPEWMSVATFAKYADMSEESARKLISTGDLTAYRPLKGKILINRREADNVIRSRTSTPRVGRGRR